MASEVQRIIRSLSPAEVAIYVRLGGTFPAGIEREREKLREWDRIAPPVDVLYPRRRPKERAA